MKKSIITILAATTLSAGALTGTAFADSNDTAEIAAFQKAQHDVIAGIKAAETASGGKAVSAEFDHENGAGLWEVETVNGTKYAEVRIDAATGNVVSTKDKSDRDDAVTPQMLGAPLADLASKAAATGAGKVMSIEAEHDDGKFRGIEVEILKADGTVHDFILGAADGKLTPAVEGRDDQNMTGENNG